VGNVVMGPVLIVHDSDKMARGEACTTFYRFKPGTGPTDEIVSFHCRRARPTRAETTTFTTVYTEPGCKRLVEYQIGGDAEVHGVPFK
jgi:urease beta subunit